MQGQGSKDMVNKLILKVAFFTLEFFKGEYDSASWTFLEQKVQVNCSVIVR